MSILYIIIRIHARNRLSDRFSRWCKDESFIERGVDVFGEETAEIMPQLICLWIISL